jgi:nucleoside-diphosphate-sugar epimerase|tara:strand:- start:816 stop:1742 length:927 start_codon:yes stop_codon:yes gene_type:complete
VKKLVCVLGCSGYIGSYLATSLKKKFRIITHSRRKVQNHNFNNNIYKNIQGDIQNKKVLEKIVKEKPNIIIYPISFNHFISEKNLNESLKNNYEPLQNLIKEILKRKIKVKIIYFSTMQVIGRTYTKTIIDENYPKNISNIYSLTHSMCEDLLLNYQSRIPSHSLRLSNSFGMPAIKNLDCWWPVLNDLCKSAKLNKKIEIKSDGSALRDFISLKDISSFIQILINKKINKKIINLCSGKSVSIRELAEKVAKNKYFKNENIKLTIKKKANKNLKKKRFKYNNLIMKKNGFAANGSLDEQITEFLKLI